VNDQCKGPGDAADVRGKVPSRAEYVVSDYTTVKETGAQVRACHCVWECCVSFHRMGAEMSRLRGCLKTAIAAFVFVLRFDWFELCCTLLAGVTKLTTSSGARSVRGRMLRLFFTCCFLCVAGVSGQANQLIRALGSHVARAFLSCVVVLVCLLLTSAMCPNRVRDAWPASSLTAPPPASTQVRKPLVYCSPVVLLI
jgi:hypothetical protein